MEGAAVPGGLFCIGDGIVVAVVVPFGAAVVVSLAGVQPGCGMHRLNVPVMQKHQAHVTFGGVQNWATLQAPVTRGGTKWMLTESMKMCKDQKGYQEYK